MTWARICSSCFSIIHVTHYLMNISNYPLKMILLSAVQRIPIRTSNGPKSCIKTILIFILGLFSCFHSLILTTFMQYVKHYLLISHNINSLFSLYFPISRICNSSQANTVLKYTPLFQSRVLYYSLFPSIPYYFFSLPPWLLVVRSVPLNRLLLH